MRITDMEFHHSELERIEDQIKEKETLLDFSTVFALCQASFLHVEPAFKFRKKRGITPESPALRSFSVLWKYGPPLFEYDALQAARDFIASTRFLARHENNYLEPAEAAMAALETARVLWNCIESNPGFLQRSIRAELGLDQEQAVSIVELWERLAVVDRRPEQNSWRLYLRTVLTRDASGICMNCGLRVKGRKEILLKPVKCQRCSIASYFYLPAADPA